VLNTCQSRPPLLFISPQKNIAINPLTRQISGATDALSRHRQTLPASIAPVPAPLDRCHMSHFKYEPLISNGRLTSTCSQTNRRTRHTQESPRVHRTVKRGPERVKPCGAAIDVSLSVRRTCAPKPPSQTDRQTLTSASVARASTRPMPYPTPISVTLLGLGDRRPGQRPTPAQAASVAHFSAKKTFRDFATSSDLQRKGN
jgi:hypothetical protein